MKAYTISPHYRLEGCRQGSNDEFVAKCIGNCDKNQKIHYFLRYEN